MLCVPLPYLCVPLRTSAYLCVPLVAFTVGCAYLGCLYFVADDYKHVIYVIIEDYVCQTI